ncbi:DUF6474 family protein [Actinomycetes bacterium M1A6_2h]
MALFTKRTSRATRKAEAKALLHKAKIEAKLNAKNERKQLKELVKNDKKALANQQKLDRAALKTYEAQQKAANEGKLTVGKVRKYIAIARVVSPILMPIAYKLSTVVRAQLDERRASRIGVGVGELAEFTGHGGALSARISGAEKSVKEIESTHSGDEVGKFVAAISGRLTELTTAVRAAEQMPPARRKIAHAAIGNELDGIEADILARLGVR